MKFNKTTRDVMATEATSDHRNGWHEIHIAKRAMFRTLESNNHMAEYLRGEGVE